jgi:hypothetical protein
MRYRVRFLDAAGAIVRELIADAFSLQGAIEMASASDWPPRAVHMMLVDEGGAEVYSRETATQVAG